MGTVLTEQLEEVEARPPAVVRFAAFEFSPSSRELRKHGVKIKMSRQASCILACLLERPAEVVTRAELCELLWPDKTHVDFEGSLNVLIRDVREALGDSARKPRFIQTVPKQGYQFIAALSYMVQPAERTAGPEIVPSPAKRFQVSRRLAILIAAGAGLLLTGSIVWWLHRPSCPSTAWLSARVRVTQLSNFDGTAQHPTISPDGTRVAFQWNGDERGGLDVYVKRFGSPELLRLTHNPMPDLFPAWSPDGRDIAFIRRLAGGGTEIMLVPATGGPERQLTTIPGESTLSWSADSKWLAYSISFPNYFAPSSEKAGIWAVSLVTGQKMQLTSPGSASLGDCYPSFSPDGHWLAFIRVFGAGAQEVGAVALGNGLHPANAPRQLTFDHQVARDTAWTPDSKEIIFASQRKGGRILWRIPVAPGARREPLLVGGDGAIEPAVDVTSRRILYSRLIVQDELRRLDLRSPGSPASKLLYPQTGAGNPSYAPDGRRIAFQSLNAGVVDIWVASSDGSNQKKLSFLQSPMNGTPRWSPDGLSIAFDARIRDNSELFVIPPGGGTPIQLTDGTAENVMPNWSHDGKWLYFGSNRSGRFEIWKLPAAGGEPVQVTRQGGFYGVESTDGREVYYAKGMFDTELWAVPAAGGEERRLASGLSYCTNFAPARAGIYFIGSAERHTLPLLLLDPVSRQLHKVTMVAGVGVRGIALAPDGNSLLLSVRDSATADLMTIEPGN